MDRLDCQGGEDMQRVLTMIPLGRVGRRVIEQVQKGPIVLTDRGKSVAVLVGVDLWNDIADEVERLRSQAVEPTGHGNGPA